MCTLKLLIYQDKILKVLYNPNKTKQFVIINCLLPNNIKSEEYYSMKNKLKSFIDAADASNKKINTMKLYSCPIRTVGFSLISKFSSKEELQFVKRRMHKQGLL